RPDLLRPAHGQARVGAVLEGLRAGRLVTRPTAIAIADSPAQCARLRRKSRPSPARVRGLGGICLCALVSALRVRPVCRRVGSSVASAGIDVAQFQTMVARALGDSPQRSFLPALFYRANRCAPADVDALVSYREQLVTPVPTSTVRDSDALYFLV